MWIRKKGRVREQRHKYSDFAQGAPLVIDAFFISYHIISYDEGKVKCMNGQCDGVKHL